MKLSYLGTRYSGWQRQPAQLSVQEVLEDTLSKILREEIVITGCGRTDAGVHAQGYVAHFDFNPIAPENFVLRMNKTLPPDISIAAINMVKEDAHARFDAIHRAYEYHITLHKNPFDQNIAWYYPYSKQLQIDLLNEAASILPQFKAFFPFCKTNTQVKTMNCDVFRSEWEVDLKRNKLVFHIAANRFLRGMVRLIVGMCINVATGKLELAAVRQALETQSRLPKPLSVPPQGLRLTDIRYPYEF